MLQTTWITALANHLWQSTVVVATAWLLAFMLRKNQARMRYWIWLIASVKFLIPLFLLIELGGRISSMAATLIARPVISNAAISTVVEQITQPFPQSEAHALAPAAAQQVNLLPIALVSLWVCGALILVFTWARNWRRIRSAVRGASHQSIATGVPVFSSPTLLEPGVFGIFRPVLMLPEGIANRLNEAQLRAVIAHEMCHVRRRDNLTFALHMIVETIFWFHPLVWWIRARLIEERERACDEAVVQSGNPAEVYAEGILNVCRFYVESPLACASGVTGSDLKQRIVRIMTEHVALKLDFRRKLLLSLAGMAAILVPVVFGVLHSAQIHAQSQPEDTHVKLPEFDVATIRPGKPGARGSTFSFTHGGGIQITNGTVKGLIEMAYDVRDFQIDGGPGWVNSVPYNIVAKATSDEPEAHADDSMRATRLRLQTLLAQRFQLKIRRETRDLPVYVLTVSKNGARLVDRGDSKSAEGSPVGILASCGQMTGTRTSTTNLAYKLSRQLNRVVIDRTDLSGTYDFQLSWTPDLGPCSASAPAGSSETPASSSDGPSIFTALQEQLGLKLEPQKGPVNVIVIDHIEEPSPN